MIGSNGGRWLIKRMWSFCLESSQMSNPWRFKVPSPLTPEKFRGASRRIRDARDPTPRVSRITIWSVRLRPDALRWSILKCVSSYSGGTPAKGANAGSHCTRLRESEQDMYRRPVRSFNHISSHPSRPRSSILWHRTLVNELIFWTTRP